MIYQIIGIAIIASIVFLSLETPYSGGAGGGNTTNYYNDTYYNITGEITTSLPAENITAGNFGYNVGNGNYTFPDSLVIYGTLNTSNLLTNYITNSYSISSDTYTGNNFTAADTVTANQFQCNSLISTTDIHVDGIELMDYSINTFAGDLKINPYGDVDLMQNALKNITNATDAQDAVAKSQLDIKQDSFPIGSIIMFSGTYTDNVTIPCWFIADGTDGTVNLVGQFIRGGSTSGATGGSDTNSHTHDVDVAITTNTSGAEAAHTHTYTQVPNHVHVVPIYSGTTDGIWATFDASSTTPGTVRNINSNNPTGGVATGTTNAGSSHTHSIAIDPASVTSGAASDTGNIPAYTTLIYIQRRC